MRRFVFPHLRFCVHGAKGTSSCRATDGLRFEAAKRNDIHAIGTPKGELRSRQHHEEGWFAHANLINMFGNLQKILRRLVYPSASKLYLYTTPSAVRQRYNKINFKSVPVAKMRHLTIHSLGIDAKVAAAHRFKQKTERHDVPQQTSWIRPQNGRRY